MSRLFKFKMYGKKVPAPIVVDGHTSVISHYRNGEHKPGIEPPREYVVRCIPKDFQIKGEWGVALSEDEAMLVAENLLSEINKVRAERKRRAIEKFKQEHRDGRQS